MLSASAIRCIERVRMGFVASITPGGRPSLSPKGTFVVLDDCRVAFGEFVLQVRSEILGRALR